MAVNGSTTNANGDALLISINEPYRNVVEIISYEDVVHGETTDCFFKKSFRWGIDGVAYSDWIELSNPHLKGLMLSPNNPFWIQYKYEQVGDGTLEFESIALETVTTNGKVCLIPQLACCDGQSQSGSQNLAITCCSEPWNPYDISRAGQAYAQLSSVVSNIFGFCVKYFKTAADQRSRDVILKEYSLYNVIQTSDVKLLVPDNALPTRAIQFNPMMMDYPVQFEVHIVKSEFQKVFGVGSKPQMQDYLYFEQFLNKMYQVDSVAESDDFLYQGSYWRVSLVAYQQKNAIGFLDTNIEIETEDLISSVETKFAEETDIEYQDTRKPNQYNTIGTLTNDYIRRTLDKRLIINEERVYNEWTIVSKYHYDLSSMPQGSDCVAYRYTSGWATSDSRAFTMWFRPKYTTAVGPNVLITGISDVGGNPRLTVSVLPTIPKFLIKAGDWISISGTQSYNGIFKVLVVGSNFVIIDTPFTTSTLLSTPKFNKEASNTFLTYQDDSNSSNTDYVTFTYTANWFILRINGIDYKWKVSNSAITFAENEWYSVVINLNNLTRQLSLFVYKTVKNLSLPKPVETAVLTPIYTDTVTITQINVPNGYSWKLLGSSTDLTNIRIWKTPIQEEDQELVLSQYVVNDTHLTLLLDNASPELRLQKVTNPR
jgi:hypothetical protein